LALFPPRLTAIRSWLQIKDCTMPLLRFLAPAVVAAALVVPQAASAQSFSDAQRSEIQKIIKEYLIANPEVLAEASAELEKRQQALEAAKHTAAVKKHADTLFNSPRGVIVGGRDGDVNFVEFFDYNCGFCKKAMVDMLELMKADPKLRVTLKEFPVLGQSSVEAAQVAVAVRMQDQSGKKYLDFHQKLLNSRGQIDRAKAIAAAKDSGLDMARLEKDIASPEVKATLEENFRMAEDMGLNGTPSYVIGDQVVVGAVGVEALKEKIITARRTAQR
jgi:protein-disulfide isomerase